MATGPLPHGPSEGASEHIKWRGALAFSIIGLPGNSFTGQRWTQTHRPGLLDLFINLLRYRDEARIETAAAVQGLLLCEAGFIDDTLDEDGKAALEHLLHQAFLEAGASEHGAPNFFWSDATTVAAFRNEVDVVELASVRNIPNLRDKWRRYDRFQLTENGRRFLIMNTHQAASQKTFFSSGRKNSLLRGSAR